MNSIVYVGMDVHKESFTLCCYSFATDRIEYQQKMKSDYRLILKYLEQVKKHFPEDSDFICGYEAGCFGYALYNQLTKHHVNCFILAPTTMAITNTNKVKTDKKDAGNIARCLAFHTYREVHIPTQEDNAVKEYIRMRDDQKKMLKMTKQQILSLVLRHGYHYEGGKSYWTITHVKWLRSLELGGELQEALDEYMITYEYLTDKICRLDARIEEIASKETYSDKVKKLSCFIGIKTHIALSIIVEIGDFERFAKAEQFAGYLGLTPKEDSSGDNQKRSGITKAGNGHLRCLLTEAAQSYTKGAIGHKSIALKQRQKENSPEVIAYADKGNERLRRRFYHLTLKNGLNRNKATTAIARELSGFIWGMKRGDIA